jgi:hypothetical protein
VGNCGESGDPAASSIAGQRRLLAHRATFTQWQSRSWLGCGRQNRRRHHAYPDLDPCPIAHLDAHSHAYGHTDQYAHLDANRHPYTLPYTNRYRYPHAHAHANLHAYAYTHTSSAYARRGFPPGVGPDPDVPSR